MKTYDETYKTLEGRYENANLRPQTLQNNFPWQDHHGTYRGYMRWPSEEGEL